MPEPIRILLSESASAALLATGNAFIVAGRASVPDMGNRVALHLLPCDLNVVNAATSVALGTHKAVKIKTKEP